MTDEMANRHRRGVGIVECHYCGRLDCDYDCDESEANGFNDNPQTCDVCDGELDEDAPAEIRCHCTER
jgi:hypothetical protein